MKIVDDESFDEYAIAHYYNPDHVSVLEFLDDIKKIRYVKRLLNKYREKGELRERLILNHIIFLANVFGVEGCVTMLTYKVGKENKRALNSFFVFLNYYYVEVDYDKDVFSRIKKSVNG